MTTVGLYRALIRLLPVWFLVIDSMLLGVALPPGSDAIIYVRAARAFVAGGNPWQASIADSFGRTYHFAGLPPTVLAFVPWALLADTVVAWLWVAVSAAAALFIVRRVGLPLAYLGFPPLVLGVYSGNPQIAVVALLLAGWGPLAAVLKVYAVIPMMAERRWRGLALTAAIFVGTLALAAGPWRTYLDEFGAVSARLTAEGISVSAWGQPLLIAVTVAALGIMAVANPRRAGWLAVPALWPAAEFHYLTMGLPVVGPLALFVLAMPIPWMSNAVIVAYAAKAVLERRPSSRLLVWTARLHGER